MARGRWGKVGPPGSVRTGGSELSKHWKVECLLSPPDSESVLFVYNSLQTSPVWVEHIMPESSVTWCRRGRGATHTLPPNVTKKMSSLNCHRQNTAKWMNAPSKLSAKKIMVFFLLFSSFRNFGTVVLKTMWHVAYSGMCWMCTVHVRNVHLVYGGTWYMWRTLLCWHLAQALSGLPNPH